MVQNEPVISLGNGEPARCIKLLCIAQSSRVVVPARGYWIVRRQQAGIDPTSSDASQ